MAKVDKRREGIKKIYDVLNEKTELQPTGLNFIIIDKALNYKQESDNTFVIAKFLSVSIGLEKMSTDTMSYLYMIACYLYEIRSNKRKYSHITVKITKTVEI